jgi:hypothetical protein
VIRRSTHGQEDKLETSGDSSETCPQPRLELWWYHITAVLGGENTMHKIGGVVVSHQKEMLWQSKVGSLCWSSQSEECRP